jgi:amino acid transporter
MIDRVAAPTLRRTLGPWRVTLTGIGVILGAGVYALVGPAAAQAGGAMWLAFLLAGLTAGLTAYSYARFARLRPKDSPEFQYTAMAFGPRAGFVAGWLMLAGDLLGVATVALGFGGYLAHVTGTAVTLNAVLIVLVAAALMLTGIGNSVGFAIALTLVEAAGLLFIGAIGLPAWPRGEYLSMPHGLSGVWGATALIFFAYIGFDELGNFAEEMREPERDLPRALFVSMAVTTAIYVLVALSVVAVAGWQEVGASSAPLALVARTVLGPAGDRALTVVALCATGNTVLLLLVAAARSVYGMAAAGVLPRALGRVSRGAAIPITASAAVVAVTVAALFLGDIARVAAMTDTAVLASFIMVNLALASLARRGTIPRARADVLVPALATALCAWLMLHTGWAGLVLTVILTITGVLAAAAMRRTRGGPER